MQDEVFLVKFGALVCEVVLNLHMDHAEPNQGLHCRIVICEQKRAWLKLTDAVFFFGTLYII
jgi:hypothetical protein